MCRWAISLRVISGSANSERRIVIPGAAASSRDRNWRSVAFSALSGMLLIKPIWIDCRAAGSDENSIPNKWTDQSSSCNLAASRA